MIIMIKENKSQQRQTTKDKVHNQGGHPTHNVQELRFPEFTEEWIITKLDKETDITMGQSPSSKYFS